MRLFRINYNEAENLLPDGYVLGNQGEHNATILTVTPPDEMTENENITSYRIAFELSNCRTVHSKDIVKSDVISLPLFSQITSSETIAVQLEGYDDGGELVVKSEKVTKLKFNPSVCGVEIPPSDSPNSMAAEVKLNTEFRENFKGSSRPTETIELIDEGIGNVCAITIENSSEFVIGDLWGEYLTDDPAEAENKQYVKVGAEIKTIAFQVGDDTSWIDIHDMHFMDNIICAIAMSKIYKDYNTTFITFAVVSTLDAGTNYIHTAIQEGQRIKVRVTYYTD